jgi:multicomponent Na+:H+ antiporter subunit D
VDWLLPLPVAIPLLTGAVLVAAGHLLHRRALDAIGIAAAAASCGISLVILTLTQRGDVLHWFGGWQPRDGVALGIDFAADPFGAGMAALAGGLTLLALVFSWTYMREESRLFDVLMLIFCGGMAGLALTGDLFNMFVWFELMGVAAYALAGFKVEELGPVQGAFNFAITNTIGAYLMLIGIALLYGRTGALNLAQIGETLAGKRPDGLVAVALTLVLVGFLVKAAVVPFHLWLDDAHAVAPAPACVLFSGAMVELGLFAVARVYWTVFSGSLGEAGIVHGVLLWLGVVTALLGALMCFLQRHLKRLLAYSTISHAGVMLAGIALFGARGLAGTANLVISHAFLKGGLFLAGGILLQRLRAVDELRLHGRGRELPLLGVLFGLGAVGMIGIPYVGTFLGHSLIDDDAARLGEQWVPPLITIAAAVSAGAILRAGARIFLGWGPADDPLLSQEPAEEPSKREAALPLMLAVVAVAVVLGLVAGVVPGLHARSEQAAERFRDRAAYAEHVLRGTPSTHPSRPPFAVPAPTRESWAYGIGAAFLAVATALFGLYRTRLPRALRAVAGRMLGPPVEAVRAAHSGLVGDYVTWIVVGTATISTIWIVALR